MFTNLQPNDKRSGGFPVAWGAFSRLLLFFGVLIMASHPWRRSESTVVSITEAFTGNTAPGWVFGGNTFTPFLTGGTGLDTLGNGWLRMTTNTGNLSTYAYYNTPVPSQNTTIYSEFDFAFWEDGGSGAADGLAFFIFDGSQTFAAGAFGGSLGYAQKTGIDGLAGGYIGLGLDNWGNYSNPTEGRIGGPGFIPNAIAVRGPGSGETGYEYIAGTSNNGVPDLSVQMDFPSYTSRPFTTNDYRKVQITLSPANQLTVQIKFGTNDFENIYIADLSAYSRPDTIKMGFSAATGGAMSIHEIRNFSLTSFDTLIWDNGLGSALWGDDQNWQPDQLPAAGSDVLLNNLYVAYLPNIDNTQNIDMGGQVRSMRSLSIDAPFSYNLDNGTLKFDQGSSGGILSLTVSKINGSADHTLNANVTTVGPLLIKNTSDNLFTMNGSLTNGGNRVTFDGAGTILMGGVASGAGGLDKSGLGTLILSGTNTYSGGTILYGGALGIGSDRALGTGTLQVQPSGEIFASGAARSVTNAVSLRGDTTISGSQNLTFSGPVTQFGGDRTVTLNNTGTTTISGNVALSDNNTARTLTLTGPGDATVSGIISNGGTGAGNLTKGGTGTLTLSGANTYTGTTTVNGGTLLLAGNDRLNDSSDVVLNNATFNIGGFSDRVDDFGYTDATLDYGTTGAANHFMFNNDLSSSGVLTVLNWESATDKLAYRNSAGAPSSGFLDGIYFSGYGSGAEVLAGNQNQSISGYSTGWDFITPKPTSWEVWDGGAGGSNWNSNGGNNWLDNTTPSSSTTLRVSFDGSTRTTPVMNANYTVNSLQFTNTASSFTLTSSASNRRLTMDGVVPSIMQKSANDQTVQHEIIFNTTTIVDTIGTGLLNLDGILSGSGGLSKYGTNTLVLGGNNTYTGATVVNQGTVRAASGTAFGGTGSGLTVLQGAMLELTNTISVGAEALSISGTGIGGAGVIRNIGGTNSWSGAVTLAGDALIGGVANSQLTLSGGISGSGKNLEVGSSGDTVLSGAITTGSGTLTKTGSGTLTLSGGSANTYTGSTYVNAGTLQLNKSSGDAIAGNVFVGGETGGTNTLRLLASNQINDSSVVNIGSSGVFDLNGFNDTISGISSASTNSQVQLGSGRLTVDSFFNSSFDGKISGSGGLSSLGISTLTLGGSNTYSGTTLIGTGGILKITAPSALGSVAGGTVVSNGATLQIQGDIAVGAEALTLSGAGVGNKGAVRNIFGNNSWDGNVAVSTNSRINSDLGVLTFNGDFSSSASTVTVGGLGNVELLGKINTGSGGLTMDGLGTLTLGGSNAFTGAVDVQSGVVVANNSNAFGTTAGGVTVATNASVHLRGGIAVGNEALAINGDGGGPGALRNLQDNNSWAGAITLNGDSEIASDAGTLTLSGNIGGSTRTLTISGGGDVAISGAIGTGTGGLTKEGGGTLTLSGNNTYTGATTVTGGTLAIGAANRISDTSNLSLTSATLNLGGFSERVGDLAYNNATLNFGSAAGANHLMFNNDGAAAGTLSVLNWETGLDRLAYPNAQGVPAAGFLDGIYFSGYGSGAEVLAGNQNQAITGYGAGWDFITPKPGTWEVWDGGATGNNWDSSSGANWLDNTTPVSGSTLRVSFAGTTRLTPVMNANYTVNSLQFTNGAGAFNLTSSGGSKLTMGGTLPSLMQKSTNNQAISSGVVLGSTTVVDAIGAGSLSLNGVVEGSGGILKYGAGTLNLAGANTYTGAVSIFQGEVTASNSSAFGTTAGGVTVAGGAALSLTGGIAVGAEALDLSGSGMSNAGALRNISGTNSWAGNVTLSGNSTVNSDAGQLTVSGGISGANKSLEVGGAGNVVLSGAITTGAGTFTKTGAGAVTLSGSSANTFTGDTSIQAGTLVLAKSNGVNAIADGEITINSGGTLLLGANNQIANAANTGKIKMAGGTFHTGGFSEGTANDPGVGSLTLTANSVIDMGTGASFLHFETTYGNWGSNILSITNWSGNIGGGGTDRVYFSAITDSQLAQIRFVNPGGSVGTVEARRLATGEIVPVPEPSTVAALVLMAGGVMWRERRRLAGLWSAVRASVRG